MTTEPTPREPRHTVQGMAGRASPAPEKEPTAWYIAVVGTVLMLASLGIVLAAAAWIVLFIVHHFPH